MLNRGELEGRFDPFFYIPELVALERKVWEKGAQPLRRFIHRMASGATPTKAEEEKFYSTKQQGGIPFIRVQNLKETSELVIDDLKYINDFTHNEYLKRSQVNGGDLLTKITGVGRMAVSAVAPNDFISNINQHIVVSKTKNHETSEFLAAYLNSDLGERLASRRATGGTRPALDYPALRSIPIVFAPAIVEILTKAVGKKRQQEAQAQALLESIDSYLLGELGITLPPEPENTIENRMFKTSWQQVSGGRFDPISSSQERINAINAIQSSKYPQKRLHNVAHFPKVIFTDNSNLLPYLGLENIESNTGFYLEKIEKEGFGSALYFEKGEVLFPKLRPYLNKVHFADFEGLCSTEFVILNAHSYLNNQFLAGFLRSKAVLSQTKYLSSGNTLPRLQTEDTRRLLIPVPPIDVQEWIADHINSIQFGNRRRRYGGRRRMISPKQSRKLNA